MVFQSGVAAEGGGPHLTLTYAVAVVLVASVGTFATMLGLEVWNSVRFARKARSTRRASGASPALDLKPRRAVTPRGVGSPAHQSLGIGRTWLTNPMRDSQRIGSASPSPVRATAAKPAQTNEQNLHMRPAVQATAAISRDRRVSTCLEDARARAGLSTIVAGTSSDLHLTPKPLSES
jgi:hypothetical protein